LQSVAKKSKDTSNGPKPHPPAHQNPPKIKKQ